MGQQAALTLSYISRVFVSECGGLGVVLMEMSLGTQNDLHAGIIFGAKSSVQCVLSARMLSFPALNQLIQNF